jgi:hypothetical protein
LAAASEPQLQLSERVDHPQQVPGGESFASRLQRLTYPVGDVRRGSSEDERKLSAQHVGEPGEEHPEVDTGVSEAPGQSEDVAGTTFGDEIERRQKLLFGNEPQRLANPIDRDSAFSCGQHLVGETQRVAHRSVRRSGDRRQRVRFCVNPFGVEHVAKARPDLGHADALQVEALEPA